MSLTHANVNGKLDKRILVLGSAPHTQLVTAYTWDNIPQFLNVADYDVVILNLVPFLDKEFAQGIDTNTLPSIRQFAHLLFSDNSEIIAIGTPEVTIGSNLYQGVDWWLPVMLEFVYDSGQEIRDIDPEFGYYFQQVREWIFYATCMSKNAYNLSHYLTVVDSQANNLHMEINPIAETRFQKPIAFELQFKAVYIYESDYFPERKIHTLKESGSVIWLPSTTEISDYDAVNLILVERYGLCLEQAPPTWVEAYKLPQQIPIEAEISHYKHEIQRLERELTTAQQKLLAETRFCKLLYFGIT